MKSIATDIGILVPDPENARLHNERNMQAITTSIDRFGQVEPLVVQEGSNIVIGGNGRLEAMKSLGFDKVDVVFVPVSDDEAKVLALALNRTAELAEWDGEQLSKILKEFSGDDFLDGFDGILPDMMQFDDNELMGLIEVTGYTRKAPGEGELIDPPTPELPEAPITQMGNIWKLGRHRIICGDAEDPETVERLLGGVVPGMMVTDPPYGVEYDAQWRADVGLNGEGAATGLVLNDDRHDWRKAYALSGADVIYVWHDGKRAHSFADSIIAGNYEIRRQIIWAKPRLVVSRGHYHWMHESCWYAVMKGKTADWIGDRKQTTLWQIDNTRSGEDTSTGHSTQKPLEAMGKPMRNHGFPEVYDPFLGSGTTLIAAEQLDRICYGVELNPAYCDIIIERWQTLTGEQAELVED